MRWRLVIRTVGWMMLAALAGSAGGCGKSKQPWEKVYPVTGALSFKGQPIAGAQITLVPQDEDFPASVRPRAVTKDDGSFDVSTYTTGDGAPAGEYKAIVIWHPLDKSRGEPVRGPNKLPAKYAKPETSDLVIQVSDASTELPKLELK